MAGRRRPPVGNGGPRAPRTGESNDGQSREAGEPREADARDPEAAARGIVLRQLTRGPRTRAQLAATLARRGIPEDAAGRVLDRFTDVGLVDDEAFAEAWVETRHAGRGLARRALAHELRTRGVGDETVDAALDTLPGSQEVETARALVRQRLRATRGADREARVRRVAGLLARKGYSGGLAFRLIREELEAEGAQTEGLLEPDPW